MEKYYYKESNNLINGVDADEDYTSKIVKCIGHGTARVGVSVVGLTDAGTIDQTVEVFGAVEPDKFSSSAIATVNITGTSPLTASFISAAIDIRGYSWLRLKYSKKDASAGTVSSNLNTILGY